MGSLSTDAKNVERFNSLSSNTRSPSPSSRSYKNMSPTPSQGSNGGTRCNSRLSFASDDMERGGGSMSLQKMHSVANQEFKDKLSYKNPDLSNEDVPNYMKQTCTSLVKIQTVKMKDRNKKEINKSGHWHRSTKSENLENFDYKKKSKNKKRHVKEKGQNKYGPEKALSCPLDQLKPNDIKSTMALKPNQRSSFDIHRQKLKQKKVIERNNSDSDETMEWSQASSNSSLNSRELNHLDTGMDGESSVSGEDSEQSVLEEDVSPHSDSEIEKIKHKSQREINLSVKNDIAFKLTPEFNKEEIVIDDNVMMGEEEKLETKSLTEPLQMSFAFRASASPESTPRARLGNGENFSACDNQEKEETLLSTLPSVTFGGTTIIPEKELISSTIDSPKYKEKVDIASYNIDEAQSEASEFNRNLTTQSNVQQHNNDQNDTNDNNIAKTIVDIGFGAVAGAITAAIFFLGAGGNRNR